MVNVDAFLAGIASTSLFSWIPFQFLDVLYEPPLPAQKSVAIVGAGGAGLAMLQALSTLPEPIKRGWNFVLFEEREDIGGVWLPDSEPPTPPNVPETPLYEQLHTNSPVPFMTYPELPFPPGTPLYPSHEHFEAYLERYAQQNDLRRFIRFNNSIEAAAWIGSSKEGFWNVTIHYKNGGTTHQTFSHLVDATGNYRVPHTPTWPGQDSWLGGISESKVTRKLIHSVYYRKAKAFANETVLIIGSSASARDIAKQVAGLTTRTYMSTRHEVKDHPIYGSAPQGVEYKPDISHFNSTSIVFTDGTAIEADTILLCTGYLLRKPFLERTGILQIDPTAKNNASSHGNLTTNNDYIFPLHRHVLSLSDRYPLNALSFIGLLKGVIANCEADAAQSLFAAYAITQPHILPSRKALLESLAADEERSKEHGVDPYVMGHMMTSVAQSSDYQDELLQFLKDKDAYPKTRRPFVEQWRRDIGEYINLRRAWERLEELGRSDGWSEHATTEDDWADVMYKIHEWDRKWEEEHGGEPHN